MAKNYPDSPPGSAFYRWALGSGRAAYFMLTGETERVPVLVELNGVTIEEFASGKLFFDDQEILARWQLAVSVAPLFKNLPEMAKGLNFVAALVTEDFFRLRDDPKNVKLQEAIPLVSLGPPLRERDSSEVSGSNGGAGSSSSSSSGPSGAAPPDVAGADGDLTASSLETGPVIVGIIDDGIAFANARFRNGNQTRIEYLWLQDPLPGLPWGRELSANNANPLDRINKLLVDSTHGGQVDEDEVYQSSGVLDFAEPGHKSLGHSATHGAAVMDIATGYLASDRRDDRPIIAVQPPTNSIQDTSLDGFEFHLFLAMLYILFRAIEIAHDRGVSRLPVVINFSFGNMAGPHDGTSILERAIQVPVEFWRAAGWSVEVVLPSGNNHLSRGHVQIQFAAKSDVVELPWRVLPDDRTPSYLQIWLPFLATAPVTADRVRVRVIAPGGTAPADAQNH